MSLDDLNREQKRQMKRTGALDEKGGVARAPKAQPKRERTGGNHQGAGAGRTSRLKDHHPRIGDSSSNAQGK